MSITPTAASANANANRRPRAQSMHQFGDKAASALAASARECNSSGSFVSKLFRMVESEPSTIVSWIRGGTAFCIVDPKMMAEHCLPKYFRHRRFSSLIRQLNFYSFYRVQEGQLTIYQHSFFRKGRPDLLVHIKRRGAGKAKDPWFDPLAAQANGGGGASAASAGASSTASSHTTSSNGSAKNSSSNSHTHHASNLNVGTSNQPLNLSVIGAMTSPSGMMCYSPMSKPVMMMENMSPALKPGMAPMGAPPMMDLGESLLASPTESALKQQRWEQFREGSEQGYAAAPALHLKNKFLYMENAQSPMLRPSEAGGLPAPLDLDIQDFLTDDCSINAGMSEMKSQLEDRLGGSSMGMGASMLPLPAKHAMVSRDLLKWDAKSEESASSQVAGLLGGHDDGATFEDELLLDLATVEPDTWEVPLSPLNEEEDMMPWLDLCF
ncbi:hypothetical protein PybrP1_013107 [[Pythium] brassicae (nom. inval.)]|nr:hypothetical protein PybrP1_013107 [[Pythium] brassicae (nom. inval.)]